MRPSENKLKISVIFGTRPEAIKLASVIHELKKKKEIECKICVTGQHRQMLDQVLSVFGVVPDIDLNLMAPNQSLAQLTSNAIREIDNYFIKEKPDGVIVQGDTTTVLSVSLAAFYHKIPVYHVEAGLRTGDLFSPWPEEANRLVVSRLAKLHFAPSEVNRNNLLNEGILDSTIVITGNTVIDALLMAVEKIKFAPPEIRGIQVREMKEIEESRFILITGHRRENIGTGIRNICKAVIDLSKKYSDLHFIYPVHLNPNVKGAVDEILGSHITSFRNPRIHLIPPQDYLAFVYLMHKSYLILTDSGGVQEEAPSLGKPVLVLRDTTERPEGIELGVSRLVGTTKSEIIKQVSILLDNHTEYQSMIKGISPYGDGYAGERIVSSILQDQNF